MRQRPATFSLILLAVFVITALLMPVAYGKGKGQPGVKVEMKVKIAKEFPDFPLPLTAELVAQNKQKAPKGWTEYRVIGFSLEGLEIFYKTHMPGHGWKLGHYKNNTWVWRRGERIITVIFVEIGPFTLIQVREAKG